jgi:hypothetical protein
MNEDELICVAFYMDFFKDGHKERYPKWIKPEGPDVVKNSGPAQPRVSSECAEKRPL